MEYMMIELMITLVFLLVFYRLNVELHRDIFDSENVND